VAQGRLQVGKAGAISSFNIQESKAKVEEEEEEEEESSGLQTGLYSPLQVTRRLQTVSYLHASCL